MASPNPSIRSEASFAVEGAWAEAVNTTSKRMQVLGPVDFSQLTQDMIPLPIAVQYINDKTGGRKGVRRGQFTVELELGGHGSATDGALVETDLVTLLGAFFGGKDVSAIGGALAAGSTVTSINVDPATHLAVGQIARFGAKGDGRADGQPSVIGSFAADVAGLLVALPAAPNNTDKLRAMQMIYPLTTGVVSSLRWLLATGDHRVWARGCWPMQGRFTGFGPAGQPRAALTFGVSDWDYEAASAYPSVTATAAKASAPTAGGSTFLQTVGVTTRDAAAIIQPREFEFEVNVQCTPLPGDGGGNYQEIVGAVYAGCDAVVRITRDADAANASGPAAAQIWDAGEATYKHLLRVMNMQDGRSIVVYGPQLFAGGSRPVQTSVDGLNRVRETYMLGNGPTGTNDLTRSCWRLGIG